MTDMFPAKVLVDSHTLHPVTHPQLCYSANKHYTMTHGISLKQVL